MSTALKRLIRKKQRVYNRAQYFHHENDWSEHKLLQKEVDYKLKQQHKSYISNMISESNNKKPLWYYLKTRRQHAYIISGHGSTIIFTFDLSGGRPITTASSITSRDFTLDRVVLVEVAVSAMILTFFGCRLLIFPMSVRNSSALHID